MPRVRDLNIAAGGLEHQHLAGDEHVVGDVPAQQVVHVAEQRCRVAQAGSVGTKEGMRARHDECSRNALIRHIPDDDRQPPIRQLERVVEVAADDAGRAVVRREFPALDGGKGLREELLLDQAGELELAIQPLPTALATE